MVTLTDCYASFSAMCPGNVYKQCNLNVFNFWKVLCLYYDLYNYHSIEAYFVNLPVVLFTLPFLPPALFLYLMYLFALPVEKIFGLFLPSLIPLLIPLATFFLVGISKVRLSQVFKWR